MSNAIIPVIESKGLRQFGITTGLILAGIFGVLLPYIFEHAFPTWPWVVAAVLIVWALLAPESLRPVYRGWMRVGLAISRVTTPLLLGAVFFLIVLPTGLIRRLLRIDSMARKIDRASTTYRISTEDHPKKDLENPY